MTHPSNLRPLASSTRRHAAALVRRARLASGLTQEEAARACGLSERSFRDIELGRVRMAALEALVVLNAKVTQNSSEPLECRLGRRTDPPANEGPVVGSIPAFRKEAA